MRHLLTFLVLFITYSMTGQSVIRHTVEVKAMQKYKALALGNDDVDTTISLYHNIDGTPYYYPEKQSADLVLHDGYIIEDIPLQIDLYANEFVVTNEKGTDTYLDLNFYKEIKVNYGLEVHHFKRVRPDRPEELFQVLYEDENFTLIKSKEVKHVESSLINSGQRETINKFDQSTHYDLIRNSEIARLSLKKKKFYKSFSSKEADIMKAYAKKEGLKMNEEAHFIKAVSYLGQILAPK